MRLSIGFAGTGRPGRRASDMIDIARIPSIPYVDFFVTDKEMIDYCKQAGTEIRHPYQQLFGSLEVVMSLIGIG